MDNKHDRGQLDWLVELVGAVVPAAAAAFAAARLAPANGFDAPAAMLVAAIGMFITAFTAMRVIPAEARHLALPEFTFSNDDELLLDQCLADQTVPDDTQAVAELLLDDPLPAPAADSRVVVLFAEGRMPTAGQLQHRIDRHLADGGIVIAATDDSDALGEALAELRRSLRQA